jgi:hypothetical protein
MDVILRHSQEALTDVDVLFVVRLLGKFRGKPEKVRWIRRQAGLHPLHQKSEALAIRESSLTRFR